jgi:hypothetical protein
VCVYIYEYIIKGVESKKKRIGEKREWNVYAAAAAGLSTPAT